MGRDSRVLIVAIAVSISIHAPRVGRDMAGTMRSSTTSYFNPRAPCGARQEKGPNPSRENNFNPRAPCGARLTPQRGRRAPKKISIHAPRVGRDRLAWYKADFTLKDFNPRAPCGARPEAKDTLVAAINISIHAPRVGRDGHPRCQSACGGDFNPRAPCGARQGPR